MSLADARALLSGKGARMDPERGATLAEEAARAGDAEAAMLASTVAGAGFGRPQSWDSAFDWLVRAAALGHPEARAQLLLLARMKEGEPRVLRAAIDIAAWTQARPSRIVTNRPRIGVSQRFLEPELCDWIIRRGAPLQAPARVYNPATGQPMQHDVRSNTLAMLTILELDLPILLVRQRIANTIGLPVLNLERASVFHYLPGQRFSPHHDYLDPRTPQFARELATLGQRVATFLIYLNGAFEGGETHFLLARAKFKGNTGDAVFFWNVGSDGAPDPLTQHEGAPPSSGEKWLFSQFIRDRAQLPG
jgi:prolyl 4-hydroxylase